MHTSGVSRLVKRATAERSVNTTHTCVESANVRTMTGHRHAGDDGESIPDDVVADLLSSERRRHLLSALLASDGAVAVEDLAREIAAREGGATPDGVDDATVADVREDLYWEHLPKLTATEVVAFDSLLATVELDTDDERVCGALASAE